MSSTNRVGGPGPTDPSKPQSLSEKTQPGQHRKVEKVERIKEISEIDEETKRRKFQRAMEELEDQEEEGERIPGPLDKEFHIAAQQSKASPAKPAPSIQPRDLLGLTEDVIPSPAYSPPPPNLPADSHGEKLDDHGLPRSAQFWEGVDEPPDLPVPPKVFKEESVSLPLAHPVAPEKKKGAPRQRQPLPPSQSSGPVLAVSSSSRDETPPSRSRAAGASSSRTPPNEPAERRRDKDEQEKNRSRFAASSPTMLPPLPASIAPMAVVATNQAMPFLNSDTFALYYQMVGSIYMVVETTGIARTEITLNSPAFSGSKFFGATITIEKYATAPDSLNIRLSGSDEAVTTFNQNLPSLLNAFQSGKFAFRIGRIDAVYETERKPLFRRKDPHEGRGDTGDGKNKEHRR